MKSQVEPRMCMLPKAMQHVCTRSPVHTKGKVVVKIMQNGTSVR